MCRTFAELDYSPLVEPGRVPAMVTLTYPGDWEVVAPDGASVKRHMVLWRKRFLREYGEPARYIWKLEFQRRGAPHIHLWMAPPDRRDRDRRAQRAACMRSEAVGHLFHQALVAEPRRRQGIPAHRSRPMAAARSRPRQMTTNALQPRWAGRRVRTRQQRAGICRAACRCVAGRPDIARYLTLS